ncbi:flagellar export protein FliJ [Xylophilus sp.]|uniref:flagellar export protein FliJ n=1 Tax=Xylophilus sp. TaxID=2653893 RepID=UPI0013BE599C|nr:flagellar export protein FliJ [Xylophilus sp.]KAF1047633.1 MAG: hypothetical protein GAK38_01794 [Xylophilus sp.]
MAQPSALAVAIELAERRRDAARQRLAQAVGHQQAAQAQLDQLQGYAGETQAKWGIQPHTVRSPEVMGHHYQFMARLQHAVGLQAEVMARHADHVDGARRALTEAELRVASLRKLAGQRAREAERSQQRREQKQLDEMAALQHRRRLQAGGPWS